MCRHLAYLGPPTTLAALLLEPPHGLLHQSYAPSDMRGGGTVNADGFGAGWYPHPGHTPAGAPGVAAGPAAHGAVGVASDPAAHGDVGVAADASPHGGPGAAVRGSSPVRYRSDRPIWADTSFAALAAVITSSAVLAAVRAATPGMPVVATAAAPFAEGRWLFSHNGMVAGWPHSVAGLASALPVTDLLTLDSPTDAALLWALVRHRLRAGDDPAAVLAETVVAVALVAPGSRLNLLLTDGSAIWGTAWNHALAVRDGPAAVTVASEPVDSRPGWTQVPDQHLVVAGPDRHHLEALMTVNSQGAR